MKFAALGIIFTAALGTALPHVSRSTPDSGSNNINASKLPWVNRDTIDIGKCLETLGRMSPPSGETINQVCGTKNFCEKFNPADWSKQKDELKKLTEIYGFANHQACFNAHEQKPAASSQGTKPKSKLPWVNRDTIDIGKCLDTLGRMSPPSGETINQVCGTKNFCEKFNPADWSKQKDELKKLTEIYGFANHQACFDAHAAASSQEAPKDQSEPSAKLPWVEYDKSSPSLTFKYATSQSSSDNWIGIWPEDDTQAPTWGSTTWDYAKESSGSLQLTPPSSMKAGKYKAYLLSSDRTILAFLSSFDYKPESSSSSSSVAFSVKMHYNTNCGGSVNNNVDIKPGNGVCVRTNCDVGSLEIPSVGSCPDGQVRISYWQNADCGGDWYGYGYGSRGTCRGLWSNGWGFKSLWISCADPASDCIQQGTCTAAPEPATEVCRAGADTNKPDAADKTTTDNAAAFHLKTRYSGSCTGAVYNEVTVPHGNGQCIDTGCAVGSLDIDSVGNCPDGELRISYWDQPGCGGKWYGYGYASRNTCRSLWSGGWNFKSLWVSCAKQSDDCVSRGTCTIDDPSGSNVC
ncbi:hypothetical protein BB8028_0004g13460 [Beauveria bassiana]|uniref:Uncharacterized protein n=1 Tax=Beauveria bassiana TaxID=176275 RepID=A0A2S7YE27_BEABA|nr:hypothetical protein BB8028_0004g13460 [Beauveria bassiana]